MDFWGDRRGQPVQIGFILLFGILVLAFAGYQGYVVPNQNAEIEFNQFQTVDDQFTEFRSNLVNSVDSGSERSTSFTLGARYPSRLLALNPPPVSGSIETTDAKPVTITGATGTVTSKVCGSENATTRSLVYTPDYNEYRNAESISFENSFTTREFSEASRHGEQRLVTQRPDAPDRIDLLLLNGTYSQRGVGSVAIDVKSTGRKRLIVQNPTVTLPSRFGVAAWENEILDDVDEADVTSPEQGFVEIDFDGKYQVSCAVAGIDEDPQFGPYEDSSKESINPAAPGGIRLGGVSRSSDSVFLDFNNTAGDTNVTNARINYYRYTGSSSGNQEPISANISRENGPVSAELGFRDAMEEVDPEIRLDGGATTEVVLRFHSGGENTVKFGDDDWFILTLQFETGERGTYFISVPK